MRTEEPPMPDITDEKLAELEALAMAATPGPRRALPNPDWPGGVWAITANPEHNWIQAINAGLAKAASKKNALFIAATDPDAVLSLVAEVKRLRAELAAERATVATLREALEDLHAEQNGPPLLGRHEASWREAMAKAKAAIAKAKGEA